jgi:hypothetical protein
MAALLANGTEDWLSLSSSCIDSIGNTALLLLKLRLAHVVRFQPISRYTVIQICVVQIITKPRTRFKLTSRPTLFYKHVPNIYCWTSQLMCIKYGRTVLSLEATSSITRFSVLSSIIPMWRRPYYSRFVTNTSESRGRSVWNSVQGRWLWCWRNWFPSFEGPTNTRGIDRADSVVTNMTSSRLHRSSAFFESKRLSASPGTTRLTRIPSTQ